MKLSLRRFLTRLLAGDDKASRPRVKPFDDPGGYAAHGDWPFVPSDLKSVFHARSSDTEGQQDHA